ncbi:hypothetical protein HK100_003575 [Physocladia obscura]|uniref:Uncharacterized protein n=1 Tax=Physocladia obscura TaxID=109957 RepID=A0AAD5SU02_9FUNG|nr:hypothetical protein HK100_003575 [Physocladia obscura]
MLCISCIWIHRVRTRSSRDQSPVTANIHCISKLPLFRPTLPPVTAETIRSTTTTPSATFLPAIAGSQQYSVLIGAPMRALDSHRFRKILAFPVGFRRGNNSNGKLAAATAIKSTTVVEMGTPTTTARAGADLQWNERFGTLPVAAVRQQEGVLAANDFSSTNGGGGGGGFGGCIVSGIYTDDGFLGYGSMARSCSRSHSHSRSHSRSRSNSHKKHHDNTTLTTATPSATTTAEPSSERNSVLVDGIVDSYAVCNNKNKDLPHPKYPNLAPVGNLNSNVFVPSSVNACDNVKLQYCLGQRNRSNPITVSHDAITVQSQDSRRQDGIGRKPTTAGVAVVKASAEEKVAVTRSTAAFSNKPNEFATATKINSEKPWNFRSWAGSSRKQAENNRAGSVENREHSGDGRLKKKVLA